MDQAAEIRPGQGCRHLMVIRVRGRHPGGDVEHRLFRDPPHSLLELLPRYAEQGKAYVNIAFGCTGGRHRSVYTAEKMAQVLREGGFSPTVLHRNLGSRAEDLVEGTQQQ